MSPLSKRGRLRVGKGVQRMLRSFILGFALSKIRCRIACRKATMVDFSTVRYVVSGIFQQDLVCLIWSLDTVFVAGLAVALLAIRRVMA